MPNHLTPAELEVAEQVARDLNLRDPRTVSSFGADAQAGMSALADSLLAAFAATEKAGRGAEEALTRLRREVEALDPQALAPGAESALARLPLIGRYFTRQHVFISRYRKIGFDSDGAVLALSNARHELKREVARLDQCCTQSRVKFRQLLVYIAAGEKKLAELRERRGAAAGVAGPEAALLPPQPESDLADIVGLLERRVYELKLSSAASLQAASRLRAIQNRVHALIEKIESLAKTVARWKQQIAAARACDNRPEVICMPRVWMEGMPRLRIGEKRDVNTALKMLAQMHAALLAGIDDSLRMSDELRRVMSPCDDGV